MNACTAVEGLFPVPTAVCIASPQMQPAPLFATEYAAIARARPARREEFTAGRSAARHALARLGGPRVAIDVGPRREPLWPDGYTGSITHCAGFCAAVACRASAAAGLGLDAEPCQALPAEAATLVCAADEYPHIWTASAPAETVIFTAKEACLKAAATACGELIDFRQVVVRFTSLSGRDGTFTLQRRDPPGATHAYQGAWTLVGDHIVTGVWALAVAMGRGCTEAGGSWA